MAKAETRDVPDLSQSEAGIEQELALRCVATLEREVEIGREKSPPQPFSTASPAGSARRVSRGQNSLRLDRKALGEL